MFVVCNEAKGGGFIATIFVEAYEKSIIDILFHEDHVSCKNVLGFMVNIRICFYLS